MDFNVIMTLTVGKWFLNSYKYHKIYETEVDYEDSITRRNLGIA